jgi:signal transduction histidine kinase
MAEAEFSAVFSLLGTMAQKVNRIDDQMTTVVDRVNKMSAEMATKDDLTSLRQTVVEYHSAVLGHGILISELDERIRRIERQLGISSQAPQ